MLIDIDVELAVDELARKRQEYVRHRLRSRSDTERSYFIGREDSMTEAIRILKGESAV